MIYMGASGVWMGVDVEIGGDRRKRMTEMIWERTCLFQRKGDDNPYTPQNHPLLIAWNPI